MRRDVIEVIIVLSCGYLSQLLNVIDSMKVFFVLILTSFCMTNSANHTLQVYIKGFGNNNGKAMIALENAENKVLQSKIEGIKNQEVTVYFKSLPPGKYVVRMFHDENNNHRLDTNFLGMPKEGWGCSNNVKPQFGPPKHEEMIFEVAADKKITINIQ